MASSKKNIIGIDIGGSKIEAILWRAGKIVAHNKIKTPKTKKNFLAALFQVIQSMQETHTAQGIGISLAGMIDRRTGTVTTSPNLRFLKGVNLARLVEKKF